MKSRMVNVGLVGTLLALLLPSAARAQTCTYDQLLLGQCVLPNPVAPLDPATQPMFVNELPQPVFFTPDTSDGVFDYYEIFSGEASIGLANPKFPFDLGSASGTVTQGDTWDDAIPTRRVWLGLADVTAGFCPDGVTPCGAAVPCPAAGVCTPSAASPLYRKHTEVWGYGQANMAGGPLGGASTYPAMSFRATKGKPVKVMWQNKLPDVHMFCKKPMDSNYPCGIDRTLMGTLGVPFTDPETGITYNYTVDRYGGTQQPDNAMVVHLHGGEIPPDSDGFAELWFGNATTAAWYSAPLPGASTTSTIDNIDPHWKGTPGAIQPATATPPTGTSWNGNSTLTGDWNTVTNLGATTLGNLIRPTGDAMIYNYPMVQDAATIWYHDHALGKTRVNVAAGPAGYFYIQDPAVDVPLWGALSDSPTGYFFGDCTNAGILLGKCRDVPIVLQDRAFNEDGSINFPNLLGQIAPAGANPLTPGPNPTIHPQWIPEYFGDVAVVNGITWPKLTVEAKPYRLRFLDGSNARCYTLTLQAKPPKTADKALKGKVNFNLIASDQGYLPAPSVTQTFSICPGERYEAVVDFTPYPAGTIVKLQNSGGAPFPNGITPQMPGSPDAFLATMMQFVVSTTAPAGTLPWAPPAGWAAAVQHSVTDRLATLLATPPAPANTSYFVLNEVLDPVTQTPLRVQIDGKTFEDAVSETPNRGAVQYWDIVNTTVDTHPMHLHLVQFKVVGRWMLDMIGLQAALDAAGFLVPGVTFDKAAVDPWLYVIGTLPPVPGEEGFKDTAKANPGELLRIVAKWDAAWADMDPANPTVTQYGEIPGCARTIAVDPLAVPVTSANGITSYCKCVPDATGTACAVPTAIQTEPYYQPVTSGPYVWHCHIVDHEDNEMMRPTLVLPRL